MTNQQLYFAIGVPVFAVIFSTSVNLLVIVWQAKGIDRRLDGMEKRLDRIESRLTTIEQDYKIFFQDIARIKARIGLG